MSIMNDTKYNYMSLESLAIELSLPKTYLRQLIEKRAIPALDVNGRLRFNPAAVQRALDNLAKQGDGADE